MKPRPKPTKPQSRGLLFGIIGVALVVLLVAFYWLPWPGLGFDGYTPPERSQPIKTLWDWLELLIVPAVLLLGGVILDRRERERDRLAMEQRARSDRIAAAARERREQIRARERAYQEEARIEDAARENLLQHYIDSVSEMLLDGVFDMDNRPYASIRRRNANVIVVTRTLQLLRRLNVDTERRDSALKFLRDSGLLTRVDPTVRFRDADLSYLALEGAPLFNMDFTQANFAGADLKQAIFTGSSLVGAVFDGADLEDAVLVNADIEGADLREAKITSEQIRFAKNYEKAALPPHIAEELYPAGI